MDWGQHDPDLEQNPRNGDLRINHAPNEQETQEMGQSASFTPRSITLVAMRPAVKIFNKNIHTNLDGARILRILAYFPA